MKQMNKQQLTEQNNMLSRENTVLAQCVNAIANGESVWVGRKGDYSLSLVRPDGPEGGIVMVRFAPKGQKPYQSCHYFEQWFSDICRTVECIQNEEGIGLRELAYAAQRVISAAQQAAA